MYLCKYLYLADLVVPGIKAIASVVLVGSQSGGSLPFDEFSISKSVTTIPNQRMHGS